MTTYEERRNGTVRLEDSCFLDCYDGGSGQGTPTTMEARLQANPQRAIAATRSNGLQLSVTDKNNQEGNNQHELDDSLARSGRPQRHLLDLRELSC